MAESQRQHTEGDLEEAIRRNCEAALVPIKKLEAAVAKARSENDALEAKLKGVSPVSDQPTALVCSDVDALFAGITKPSRVREMRDMKAHVRDCARCRERYATGDDLVEEANRVVLGDGAAGDETPSP